MRMARRLESMGQIKYSGTTRISAGRPKWNGNIYLDEKALNLPKTWKTGRIIFVNSMSDLFHDAVPEKFISDVFETMLSTPQHTYQILTKRPERLLRIKKYLPWPNNIWMGVSVENADYKFRIELLKRTDSYIKFLSLEPLLGPLDNLKLNGIDWVIVGGESGPGARRMDAEWVRSIRDQCVEAKVAFHFKQWGGVNKKKAGRTLDNQTWDELPRLMSA